MSTAQRGHLRVWSMQNFSKAFVSSSSPWPKPVSRRMFASRRFFARSSSASRDARLMMMVSSIRFLHPTPRQRTWRRPSSSAVSTYRFEQDLQARWHRCEVREAMSANMTWSKQIMHPRGDLASHVRTALIMSAPARQRRWHRSSLKRARRWNSGAAVRISRSREKMCTNACRPWTSAWNSMGWIGV